MKSLNALIATVILGSSSLALAQPMMRDHRNFDDRSGMRDDRSNVRDDRDRNDRNDRDDRDDHRVRDNRDDRFLDRDLDANQYRALRFRRMPVQLANNLELGMRRPAYLSLTSGSIRQLRFDSDEGHAFIDSVIVMFPDGRSQSISIRQRISGRSIPLTIDVDARASGVYIYGSTRGRGSLDVVGLRR